jgi:L-threonine kinase
LDFLVTLPIAQYATATVELDHTGDGIAVDPPNREKARILAQRILQRHCHSVSASLRLTGDLPVGKGFASSSADLVATARAVAGALGVQLSAADIMALMREIEPSDGVMYAGSVAFYHRQVRLREVFGALPPATIVAVDEGGELDTVAFNALAKPFTAAERRRYGELLAEIGRAIGAGELAAIGAVATESALLNQKLRVKHSLPTMIRICRAVEGAGVVVAHSGTTVGLLISDRDADYAQKIAETKSACRRLPYAVSVHHTEPAL